jgi:hypothetical protein
MSLQNEMNRAQPIIDSLNAAIRENPLAAGLIGAGIAWIFMGGTKGMGKIASAAKGAAVMSGSSAASAGASVASAGARMGSGIASSVVEGVNKVKDAAVGVTEAAGSIVPDLAVSETVDDLTSSAGRQMNAAAEQGRTYGRILQSRLSESLEKQPLLLGALGLVIGAGVASAFATTSVEREWMGEHGSAAREKLNDVADQARDLASTVVSDLKDEAKTQGFTPDAVTKAARDMAEKVKTVAHEARVSVTNSKPAMPQDQFAPNKNFNAVRDR